MRKGRAGPSHVTVNVRSNDNVRSRGELAGGRGISRSASGAVGNRSIKKESVVMARVPS